VSLWKRDRLLRVVRGMFVNLPCPSRLRYIWNFGSLLGIFLFVQILTGLFLAFHFSGRVELSFLRVIHLVRDVNGGWLLRVIHANGARMFFILMYIHIGRGLYYGSYRFKKTWMRGVTILLLSIAVAFLGYVLPWGQISFWAATVITNLLSAIPYVGGIIVEWVWGGFAVGNPTLTRFFAFHFVFPFVILFLVVMHLLFLHETGSSNPLGLRGDEDKVVFHPYYLLRDVFGLIVIVGLYIWVRLRIPYVFIDVENFIPSNPLVTPIHIQPEWYFLFAYAILRAVPRKIGGVVALVISVIVLYIIPLVLGHRFRRTGFYFFMKIIFWVFVVNWMLLTWIGACVVEPPFRELGMILGVMYFFIYFVFWLIYEFQDLLI